MLVPEADGGGSLSGNGLLDLVLVAEEMGRLVSPGPLLPVSVVADAIGRAGSAEQRAAVLPGIVSGDLIAAWCRPDPAITARLDRERGTVTLDGATSQVEAAAQADQVLVTAHTDDGPVQVLVAARTPGVTVTPLDGLDLVRRFAEVRFDGVELPSSSVV